MASRSFLIKEERSNRRVVLKNKIIRRMLHFTFDEFEYSTTALQRGINNQMSSNIKDNVEEFVNRLLDPLRESWAAYCSQEGLGTPAITITSGYRSKELNQAVGGSESSAHRLGFAADVFPNNGRMKEFRDFCKKWFKESGRKFDQVIIENVDSNNIPKWIHIGFKNKTGEQRKQMLIMKNGNYFLWI